MKHSLIFRTYRGGFTRLMTPADLASVPQEDRVFQSVGEYCPPKTTQGTATVTNKATGKVTKAPKTIKHPECFKANSEIIELDSPELARVRRLSGVDAELLAKLDAQIESLRAQREAMLESAWDAGKPLTPAEAKKLK
jgi:hypothetical protein